MASLVLTITETLRYRGKLGQWSWALHRIAGLGTLLFFFLHIVDTSWAVFYPNLYAEAIELYQSPLFTLGEFALVACVVYHALNGFRVVIFDFKPKWWHRQNDAAKIVFGLTILILIPTFILMFGHVMRFWEGKTLTFESLKLDKLIPEQGIFALAAIGLVIGGIILSALYSLIPGANSTKKGRFSRYDSFMWSFMRISGIIILPLVFGHLAMAHVIQGVFDITKQGHTPIFTDAVNQTGSAVEYVAIRWNTLYGGVFIWRVYDAALLVLCAIHGFHGLRYVVNDYVHNLIVNRGMNIALIVTALGLIIIGSLAILNTIPVTAAQMAAKAALNIPQ